ncbi:MAG: potassium transporter [Deltaproteobacteria bacterium]|nr:potassium transporter [Deltaproteobacteria bacterium]
MGRDRFKHFTLRFLTPERTLILSFLIMILIGTCLLSLPHAARAKTTSFIDALFTATSAVCVTGLIVVDTGGFYSQFGQVVILILIQVGGLGIMTFSVFFYLLLGRSIGFRDRRIIQDTFSQFPIRNIYALLKSVFIYTIVIESVGALLLFVGWIDYFPPMTALYFSLFHAISAFCNAGFSLFSDSFVGFQNNVLVNLSITSLIILGGMGFIVLKEIFDIGLRRTTTLRISLHSKVVLTTTAALLVLGTLLIFFIERNGSLLNFPLGEKILISYFQSVTSRTAGFNTIPMIGLSNATCFMLIILMFIGASPGSCGGGIKTTNLATLVSLAVNRYKGRERANLFRRTIPHETVARSISIILASILAVTIIAILLLVTQLGDLSHAESRGLFLEYLFETVSAFGTVGLSMGVTTKLDSAGKLIIIAMMLLGRLGPLTLAFAMARRVREGEVRYAEENIIVG